MKKQKNSKSAIFAIIFVLSFSHGITAYAKENRSDLPKEKNQITTWANDRVWKYKMINGKLYKRLYDKTTASWIGEWELVK